MNYRRIKPLPSAHDIAAAHPLSAHAQAKVQAHRDELKAILAGEDSRWICIVGPCSAWPYEGVVEYARRLKSLSETLSHALKIVLRVYRHKPRTTLGWAGPGTQPDPFQTPDLAAGAHRMRQLMVDLVEQDMALADEALFLHDASAYLPLLSWVAIGARSTENPQHRRFASALALPVGMKNPTSGSIQIGVNSVIAAQQGHHTALEGHHVETFGNPYAHLVLRGGDRGPNHHAEQLGAARHRLHDSQVSHPALLVDASHDNARVQGDKNPHQQQTVLRELMEHLRTHPELRDTVKGFMLESFLKTGQQNPDEHTPDTLDREGLSITDPCLGWTETEALLREVAQCHQTLHA